MVSRSLKEQISLNKTSIYSNQSASRLPATVGRLKNRRCHFPQRPSLPNSSSATGGRTWKFSRRVSWAVYDEKGSVPQLYIYLGSCSRRLQVKNIRCLQLIFTVLFIYISVLIWNILFHSDPVLPAWKVSAELSVVSGGPENTQKCCFIYFLTGNFQKLFVNHIGVLFFSVIF